MSSENKIAELADQNVKISRALMDVADVVKQLDTVFRSLSAQVDVQNMVIERILKDTLQLSAEDIDSLLNEVKQEYKEKIGAPRNSSRSA